jgi:hypothetical protein
MEHFQSGEGILQLEHAGAGKVRMHQEGVVNELGASVAGAAAIAAYAHGGGEDAARLVQNIAHHKRITAQDGGISGGAAVAVRP